MPRIHLMLSFLAPTLALGCSSSTITSSQVVPSSGGATSTCPTGNERCPCYGNSTCAQGLECLSNVCVASTNGGSTGTGGGSGNGGTSNKTGSNNTGGTSNAAGAASIGGTLAAGGSNATGGANSTGGITSSNGGSLATGGTKFTGGAPTTGGSLATGGTKFTGGASSTGGTSMATGGALNTGGMATGGITSSSTSKNCRPASAAATQYVDHANGTDDSVHGGDVGSCAYKTLTYALAYATGSVQLVGADTFPGGVAGEALPYTLGSAQKFNLQQR